MKNFNSKIVCLLFTLTIAATSLRAQNEIKEQLVVALSEPGKPGFLKVSGLINGTIKVTGYDGKEVVVDVIGANIDGKTLKNEKEDEKNRVDADGMKRIAGGGGLEIRVEERNNHVEIIAGLWKQSQDLILTLKVPRQFSLNLNTIEGEINVDDVKGQMEMTNVNGKIELNNVSGSVVANTVNDNVIVKFKDIALDAPMAFSTVNGNVDVTFPANMKASVKMKSEMGEVFSNFDIDLDKTPSKVEKSNQPGRNWVKIENWVYGKINGGGPEIMMQNMQGNIYLRKAK